MMKVPKPRTVRVAVVVLCLVIVMWAILQLNALATPVETFPESVSRPPPVHSSLATSTPNAELTTTDCLSCLFATAEDTHGITANLRDKAWCATTRQCGPIESIRGCPDIETRGCPAILHTPVPQNHRVIHVGIRKGGPEALVQLHLALVELGFRTSLDTRRSKKEKGGPVMPFFLDVYKNEFARAPPLRWVENYDAWHASAVDGDVLIATETWQCRNDAARYLPRGVRQMQWHLTVWPRRDRTQCTIAGHTRHVAHDYMRQSAHAVMFPYVSPHIVRLADEMHAAAAAVPGRLSPRGLFTAAAKDDLVLYDSDTHLRDADLQRGAVRREAKIATGYTPAQLYALYARAKAGVDLQLPGAERFVYEAALFDVCIVVDNEMNGGDAEDLPLPSRFRVPARNLVALNSALDECVGRYDAVIGEFEPLRQHARQQRTMFLRHVRRYFSNSVHIVTACCPHHLENNDERRITRFVLATLIQVPFAVIEIFVMPGYEFSGKLHDALRENSWLAAVIFTTMSSDEPCTRGADALFSGTLQPFTTPNRSLITMFMPIHVLLTHDDAVHIIASSLRLGAQHSPQRPVVFAANHGVVAVYTSSLRAVQQSGECKLYESAVECSGALVVQLGLQQRIATFYDLIRDYNRDTLKFFREHELWEQFFGQDYD